MATSGVKVTGLKELAQFMQQLPEKLQKNVMRGALRAGAKVLEAEAKKSVAVEDGDLRESIRISTRNQKGVVTASVKSDDFKAHWIEYGTAAHWISVDEGVRPTRKTRRGEKVIGLKTLNKMLARGSLQIGGHFVGQSVHHPGSKAKPFMRPALDNKGQEAIVAAGNYMKARLTTKHGFNTSGVSVEAEE